MPPLINPAHLLLLVVPSFFRKTRIMALFRALLTPLLAIYVWFSAFRNENIYNLAHNSQVCRLRKLLNDKFDNTLRRITIGDGQPFERLYIYLDSEPEITYLPLDDSDTSNQQVYLDIDAGAGDYDFIIYLNGVSLTNNQINQLTYLVNFFKLASKKWRLQ
jgi:hypothetical protein